MLNYSFRTKNAKQNNRLLLWLTVPFGYFAEDSRKQDALVSNKIQYKQQEDYLTALQKQQRKDWLGIYT